MDEGAHANHSRSGALRRRRDDDRPQTPVPESLTSIAAAGAHYVPPLVLLWLAVFFGRTLRFGTMPLIERIARRGKPVLSAPLRRYARRLTAVWSLYFVLAAALALAAHTGVRPYGFGVAAASMLLFVSEYWIRRRIFPGESFPGLAQQVRDTMSVWLPHRHG